MIDAKKYPTVAEIIGGEDEQLKDKQEKFLEKEWKNIAREPVEVEITDEMISAKGSELACLRLYHTLSQKYPGKTSTAKIQGNWWFVFDKQKD